MRFPILSTLLIGSLLLGGCMTSTSLKAPPGYPKLIWHDEFDGDALDDTRWRRIPDRMGHGPDWSKYTSSRPDLVSVRNGCLVLKGVANDDLAADPRPYLQGQVTTRGRFDFLYGKVELRAKFEDQTGAWPAFWMLPTRGRWPQGGEIDIFERLNADPFVYQTVHSAWTQYMKQKENPPQSGRADILPGEFNVYGLEWTEQELVWSVNGKVTLRYPRTDAHPTQWPFTSPFYILLNMQLEGSWVGKVDAATLPVHLYVDWVRVWQKE